MKRVLVTGVIAVLLLTACTNEDSINQVVVATPNIEPQTIEPVAAELVEIEKELTNEEEAIQFLEKASKITSSLKTINFTSMIFSTTYFNNEYSLFNEYYGYYEGTLQRQPRLAYIYESHDQVSGTLVDGEKASYDESTCVLSTNTNYFDQELGWFSVSGDYSYGGVVKSSGQNYIGHYELDSRFRTLEHIDDFMTLFMSYPDQLRIYEEIYEDLYEGINEHNWIIELELTNGQYLEHLHLLQSNLFTGRFIDEAPMDYDFITTDDLTVLHLALRFDSAYNLLEITTFYTDSSSDYIDEERNVYTDSFYYIFFSDHNAPYTHTIPEDVILNANY